MKLVKIPDHYHAFLKSKSASIGHKLEQYIEAVLSFGVRPEHDLEVLQIVTTLKNNTQSAPVELLLSEHSFTCGDEEKSNTANPTRKKHVSKTTEVFSAYAKSCLTLWGFEPPRDARSSRNAKDLKSRV